MRGDCRPRRTERAEAGRRSQPPQKTQGPSSARNSEPAPLRAPGRFCRPPARPLRSTTHVPCSPGSTTALWPAARRKRLSHFPVQRHRSLRRPTAHFPQVSPVQQPLTPPAQRRKQSPLRRCEREQPAPGYDREEPPPQCSHRKLPVPRPARQPPPARRPRLNVRSTPG